MEIRYQIKKNGEDYRGFALFFIRKLLCLKEGEIYTPEEGFFSFFPSDFGCWHPGTVDEYFKKEGRIYARCVSDNGFGEEIIDITPILEALLPDRE